MFLLWVPVCGSVLSSVLLGWRSPVTVPMWLPRRAGEERVAGRRAVPRSSPGAGHTWAPGAASPRVPTQRAAPAAAERLGIKWRRRRRALSPQPATRSSLALALRRPGPAWCSGDVTAALVARVTASRPCLRIGATARGPLRACACARVCARVSVSAPLAPSHQPPNRLVPSTESSQPGVGTRAKSSLCVACR